MYEVPDFDHVHKELLKPGTTMMMLYEEHVENYKKEKLPYYKKTQFYDLYADHVKRNRLTMHISHKPADKVEVDWFGTTMEVAIAIPVKYIPPTFFAERFPSRC